MKFLASAWALSLWKITIFLGCAFMLREIEVAFAKVDHVHLDAETAKVRLQLPVSKRDPRATGCSRSWQC